MRAITKSRFILRRKVATTGPLLFPTATTSVLDWDCILGEAAQQTRVHTITGSASARFRDRRRRRRRRLAGGPVAVIDVVPSAVVNLARFYAAPSVVVSLCFYHCAAEPCRHAHSRSDGWLQNLKALLEEHPQALVGEIGEKP